MRVRLTFSSVMGSLVILAGCSANPFSTRSSANRPLPEQTGANSPAFNATESQVATTATPQTTTTDTEPAVVFASGAQQVAANSRVASSILLTGPETEATKSSRNTQRLGQTPAIRIAAPLQQLDQPGQLAPSSQLNDSGLLNPIPNLGATASGPQASAGNVVVLSLDSVLQMAEAQNPQISLARERINEAYARALRADTLWLPSLRAGMNYNHHEGTIQDVAGTVFSTNRSSLYGGLGANAVGAGSPAVPGVMAQFHFADAFFQPEIAAHQAAARQYSATATRNDTLRDASIAYLELARAEHAAGIAAESVENTRRLLQLTQSFAEAGQGLSSDFTRMQAELAVRQNDNLNQQEIARVTAARLVELLHADYGVTVVSGEPTIVPLDILNAQSDAATYVAEGLLRRPELAEQRHLVCEAVQRLRREQYAPLVPSVLLGMSYGAMGGGLGSTIENTGDRWDADAVAFWEIRNLGFGEHATRRETSSLVRQAQMRRVAILDRVAREVVEAHARVNARRARIALAESGIAAAEQSYQLNRERIENVQGLPIEVLQSIQALTLARRTYLDAVIDYNIAQFQLCHATGALVQQ